MEKTKMSLAHTIWKIIKWVFLFLLVAYIILVICRGFYNAGQEKTKAEVEKIHSMKITMDDVLGKNLPADPGAEADKTVQGIDANKNGIRDDVEIAIFNAYPNSAKTRAVLLQYAFIYQLEMTEKMINTKTVTEIITEEGRADSCLSDTLAPRKSPESDRSNIDMEKIDEFVNFIKNKQFNTSLRKEARDNFLEYLRSFGDSTNIECDIDYSTLSN